MLMKNRMIRQQAKFIVEEFKGWEDEAADEGENILKQFKKNLNSYEKNYNEFNKEKSQPAKRSKSLMRDGAANKENQVKLPVLTAPQSKQQGDYSSFLESELIKSSANMQQSSVINYKETKSPRIIVNFDEALKRKNRCETFVQFYRNNAVQTPQNMFLKKNRVFSISRTLKLSKMKHRKNSTKLVSYEQGNKELELQAKYSNDITPHRCDE